jgi:hypothetical protein
MKPDGSLVGLCARREKQRRLFAAQSGYHLFETPSCRITLENIISDFCLGHCSAHLR